jgi:putative ABC transport system permease protein
VVGFVLAATVLCGLLFGSMAAGWMGRATSSAALKEGGRTGAVGRSAHRLASGLVVAEVALALLLVTGAGLLVRSFQQLTRVNPGFDSRGVLAASIVLADAKYDSDDKARVFFDQLIERAAALPGVTAAAATNALPLVGVGYTSDFVFADRPLDQYGSEVMHRSVTPTYLQTMRVPLLKGRMLTAEDGANAAPVLLINEALAKQHFANEDPIGKRIAFDRLPDSTTVWYTIVGVVGSERQRGVATPPQIEVLEPFAQQVNYGMTVVLRTNGDPLSLLPGFKNALAQLDPILPVFASRSMESVRTDALTRERFLMLMLLTFAVVALVLSIVGVYGVIAQFTRQRTQEIGVRLALGAQPGDVERMVVLRGGALVAGGIGIGLVGAVTSTGFMKSMLYEVQPVDVPTFIAVAAALLGAGVLATWLPARRASRVDPGIALRPE